MSPGRFLIGVSLFVCSNWCNGQVAEQGEYRFNYAERLATDYGALFGGSAAIRRDSTIHTGTILLQRMTDTAYRFDLRTETYRNSITKNSSRPTLGGYFILDSQYRVKRIIATDTAGNILSLIRPWISELNFGLYKGIVSEQKPDGLLDVEYMIVRDGGSLEKKNAEYNNPSHERAVLVLDRYFWKAVFGQRGGILKTIQFAERKRQTVGRRVTALVERSFQLERISHGNAPAIAIKNGYLFELYPGAAPADRALAIARSLLKTDSMASLLKLASQVDSLELEERFRLKSRIRSALQLLPTAHDELMDALKSTRSEALQQLLEDAVIESRTEQSGKLLTEWARSVKGDYGKLKDLVVRISLADAITDELAEELLRIKNSATEENTLNLVELALAAYAGSIRVKEPEEYEKLVAHLQRRYKSGITDTLQYLYVVGNAGMKIAEGFITGAYERGDSMMRGELVYALRNIVTPGADSLIFQHLLRTSPGADVMGALLLPRKLPRDLLKRLMQQVIQADEAGDTSKIGVMVFLLDNSYRLKIEMNEMRRKKWKMEVYRREMESYTSQRLSTF